MKTASERRAVLLRRPVWSWALVDWANSAFATTVMAGFFPVFFKQYWSAEVSVTESTFWLGAACLTALVTRFFDCLSFFWSAAAL